MRSVFSKKINTAVLKFPGRLETEEKDAAIREFGSIDSIINRNWRQGCQRDRRAFCGRCGAPLIARWASLCGRNRSSISV